VVVVVVVVVVVLCVVLRSGAVVVATNAVGTMAIILRVEGWAAVGGSGRNLVVVEVCILRGVGPLRKLNLLPQRLVVQSVHIARTHLWANVCVFVCVVAFVCVCDCDCVVPGVLVVVVVVVVVFLRCLWWFIPCRSLGIIARIILTIVLMRQVLELVRAAL